MFVDIHSHIIPGMDDGAKDSETSLEMLKLAAADGIEHIIATPHFTPAHEAGQGGATISLSGGMNLPEAIGKKTSELSGMASLHSATPKIYPGCEVLIHPDVPDLLDSGKITTLNGSKYILIEFPMVKLPIYASETLYQIQLKGIIPIIAHPERYTYIAKNPGILQNFVTRGMLVQVNACSLTGLYGWKVRRMALKLIKLGLVHFVASDAHGVSGRTPRMSKAAALVERKFGRQRMQELFYSNGLAVLEDRVL